MFFDVPTFEEEMLGQGIREDDEIGEQMMAPDDSWNEHEQGEPEEPQKATDPLETAR